MVTWPQSDYESVTVELRNTINAQQATIDDLLDALKDALAWESTHPPAIRRGWAALIKRIEGGE